MLHMCKPGLLPFHFPRCPSHSFFPISVKGSSIVPVAQAINLGVTLVFFLSLMLHVQSVSKSYQPDLLHAPRIQLFLTVSTTITGPKSWFVCLDYCNSLFSCLPASALTCTVNLFAQLPTAHKALHELSSCDHAALISCLSLAPVHSVPSTGPAHRP